MFYEELLKKEINEDREAHGKKPLKEKDDKDDNDNDSTPSAGSDPKEFTDDIPKDTKTIKYSTTDPGSGWFRKGEHKNVFAYAIETACDKNGWILGYTINPGNQHDIRTFKGLYDKIKDIGIETLVADAGYKAPAIAKLLIDDGIKPLLPYKRPMTKDGFFKKYEYVYDEYYDCYICPGNQVLTYRTTNKDGYREYKSCGAVCGECPYLSQCTESRDHGFRYTQMYGKARMEMKVGLTFACMNLKNLAKIKSKWGLLEKRKTHKNSILDAIRLIKEKWLWDVNPKAALSTACAKFSPKKREKMANDNHLFSVTCYNVTMTNQNYYSEFF